MAGALSTEMAVGSEQPGIQQAPHTHRALLCHPALIAPAPVSTDRQRPTLNREMARQTLNQVRKTAHTKVIFKRRVHKSTLNTNYEMHIPI